MGFSEGRRISGLYRAEVARARQLTPHMARVTFAGDDLRRLPVRGFDQWFRLFLPHPGGHSDFASLPEQFGVGGYLRYLTTRSGSRPPVRNYTVRELRPDTGELDVDFVSHGEAGIAGPWARRARPGEQVALIDQGRGFDPLGDAGQTVLIGDESALPAIAGILGGLPEHAEGIAVIEIPDDADRQELRAPKGFELRWIARGGHGVPGRLALEALRDVIPERPGSLQAYLAGEQALVTEGRRHLVGSGVPKARIAFTGYWRAGRAG